MALKEEFEKQGNWLFRHRGQLPLLIIVSGALIIIWTEFHPETFPIKGTRFELPYEMFCLAVSLVGFSVRIFTTGHAHPNTSGRNSKRQKADDLNTTGIYSIVRHPLYLGNYLMWMGLVLLSGNIWFMIVFTLVYWLYYERIMFAEEQFLTGKFGNNYTDWAAGVPAFIPRFRNYKRPELPFNWRRVLKKEPYGLFALFFIFTSLDIAGELIKGEKNFNWFLITSCVIVFLLFLTLRFLNKRTKVLKEI